MRGRSGRLKSELRGEETPPKVGAEASRVGLHAEPFEPAAQAIHVTVQQRVRIGIHSRVHRLRKSLRRPPRLTDPKSVVASRSGGGGQDIARTAPTPI
jgi:hypothetical protein